METESIKNKPFMTYEEQIKKLEEKKLQIPDKDYAIGLFKEHSYFALISGYKSPFKDKQGSYKLHCTIDDIYALYCFDDKVRTILLKYILKIEKHVKSLISYSFCKINGENQQHYLNATKYNYNAQNQDDVNELIARLAKITIEPKNYPYIKHQKRKYGNIPLWVLIKALTLGTVSKMYSFLPQNIQCMISKEFDYVNESSLMQMLDLLARVRNVCTHNERLYDYQYKKGTIDDTYIHKYLGLKRVNNQYQKGKNDLFAVIIALKYLLADRDFTQMISEFRTCIDELLTRTKVIQCSQMYKYMGFPENWTEILKAPKNGDKK